MGKTLIEKVIESKAGRPVAPGDIVDVFADLRCARDFGGANVVKNIREHGLAIADAARTAFTFDCNPGGSDQKYAQNQQVCRQFARERGLKVYDIDQGIGTHLSIDQGLLKPGEIFVSTDSHANIMGAIGAFGQGMGDIDIAATWAHGRCWFKVPRSRLVRLEGHPRDPHVSAKDIVFILLKQFGANGLLDHSCEITGPYAEELGLSDRITISSMATEMGAIAIMFTPTKRVLKEMGLPEDYAVLQADADANYTSKITIDVTDLKPHVARPGHPEDVVEVESVRGTKVDSCFIGSCTNGRYEDFVAAANILRGKNVAPGVVLKMVPATRGVWKRLLKEGLIEVFMAAGALVGNCGCAGCAAGQIGQNGPGEVTVSTGNRNFKGKQGKGFVWLASPATVAASAVAGHITTPDVMPDTPSVFPTGFAVSKEALEKDLLPGAGCGERKEPQNTFRGRAWVIPLDNIDTDMIFHNRYLHITDMAEMGQYAFDNLDGWMDFSKRVKPGDLVVTGKNFGCGSSRQQAVDCFKALGVTALIAESYGAIYERNAINAGMPILTAVATQKIKDGDDIELDLQTGKIKDHTNGEMVEGLPFSKTQMEIYRRGGLLCPAADW